MTEISLDRIIGAASKRQVAFTSETAGYLVLALVDALTRQNANVVSNDLRLDAEGRVHVGRLTPCSSELMNQSIRGILREALAVAVSPRAALVRLATQLRSDSTLAEFGRELETALIPVNRAAARRALARLHRDVTRLLDEPGRGRLAQLEEQQLREHAARRDAGPVGEARIEEPSVPRDEEAVAQQVDTQGLLCAERPTRTMVGGTPRFTSAAAHCTVLGRTHQHEANLEAVQRSADSEPSILGTDGACAPSQDIGRTPALGFVERRAATRVQENNLPAATRDVEQRRLPEIAMGHEEESECSPRGVPPVEQTAALPRIPSLSAPLPSMNESTRVLLVVEHTVALPVSSPSVAKPQLAAEPVLEPRTTVECTVPLPVPARSTSSNPLPRRPNQNGPAEQASLESIERTMALPSPTSRLTAWVEQELELSEDELSFETSERQLVILESIEQTAALPVMERRLEPALREPDVSEIGLETELETGAASEMCVAQLPSAVLESIERTLALPLPAPAIKIAIAQSDVSIAQSALVAAAAVSAEQELAALPDSTAPRCEPAEDAKAPAEIEVTMALPLVRRRRSASPGTEHGEPSTWELTAVDTVIEVTDHEIQYVDVSLDIEGELQIDLAEEEPLVACQAAQTAQQEYEYEYEYEAPTAEIVTHYGADVRSATIYSSIETLSDQFAIDPPWSETELSRRLRVVAGIEPVGGLSRTPPPTETRSLEVQTPAQLEPTRRLRRTGVALGIGAAVAALCFFGNAQKGASVSVAGAPQPDALGQICRGTVNVSGVQPDCRLQIRQVGEEHFREPTRIVGTNATFSGLACGKDAELLIDGDRDGVRRIPIPATRLQPVATRPWAIAELKLDGAS